MSRRLLFWFIYIGADLLPRGEKWLAAGLDEQRRISFSTLLSNSKASMYEVSLWSTTSRICCVQAHNKGWRGVETGRLSLDGDSGRLDCKIGYMYTISFQGSRGLGTDALLSSRVLISRIFCCLSSHFIVEPACDIDRNLVQSGYETKLEPRHDSCQA